MLKVHVGQLPPADTVKKLPTPEPSGVDATPSRNDASTEPKVFSLGAYSDPTSAGVPPQPLPLGFVVHGSSSPVPVPLPLPLPLPAPLVVLLDPEELPSLPEVVVVVVVVHRPSEHVVDVISVVVVDVPPAPLAPVLVLLVCVVVVVVVESHGTVTVAPFTVPTQLPGWSDSGEGSAGGDATVETAEQASPVARRGPHSQLRPSRTADMRP
jgi:hypothetical protein